MVHSRPFALIQINMYIDEVREMTKQFDGLSDLDKASFLKGIKIDKYLDDNTLSCIIWKDAEKYGYKHIGDICFDDVELSQIPWYYDLDIVAGEYSSSDRTAFVVDYMATHLHMVEDILNGVIGECTKEKEKEKIKEKLKTILDNL